jgi:hypothetical protein
MSPKKLGAELILTVMTLGLGYFIWITTSILSFEAKADKVLRIEEKVDYIYKYLIEKKEK